MGNKRWVKILRTVGIVLMCLTAVFTIMGGVGTTCVAFNPSGFGGKFSNIAPFQWLYILFVIITLAFGVMGARAVILLTRFRSNAYRNAIIALTGGSIIGLIHMFVSRELRGSSMPVDMVTGINLITLVIFLIFRSTGLWKYIGDAKSNQTISTLTGGGLAAISSGALFLTIQFWMGPTHTIGGINYADVWHVLLQFVGWALLISGVFAIIKSMGVMYTRDKIDRLASTID